MEAFALEHVLRLARGIKLLLGAVTSGKMLGPGSIWRAEAGRG